VQRRQINLALEESARKAKGANALKAAAKAIERAAKQSVSKERKEKK
jgi:hypothetical protein